MDSFPTQLRRPLLKCTVSVTAVWRTYRASLSNALSRLNLRYQTTVSVPHNIEAAFFHNPAHSPYQPENPLKMDVPLSRVPIEKETPDAKLSKNPPYMLGRDYQASARRVFTLSVFPIVRLTCPVQTCPPSLPEPCLQRLPTPPIHSPRQKGEPSSCRRWLWHWVRMTFFHAL